MTVAWWGRPGGIGSGVFHRGDQNDRWCVLKRRGRVSVLLLSVFDRVICGWERELTGG